MLMNDLFESMQEHHAERLAIMQESNVPNAVEAAADDLHRCEIRQLIKDFYPNRGNEAAAYFDLVKKHRGQLAADRLRDDVRAEWKKHMDADRLEMAGQG